MMQLVAFQEGEERSHSVHTPRKGQQEARWGGGSASWGLRPHQTELTPRHPGPGRPASGMPGDKSCSNHKAFYASHAPSCSYSE